MEATGSNGEVIPPDNVELQIHVYRIHTNTVTNLSVDVLIEAGEQPAARILELPAEQLDGIWD